jgi:hypothetical protein
VEELGLDLVAVDAEQDQLGIAGAGLAQQVDPRAVAEVHLGSEFLGDVDHLDVAVDQRHRDPGAISVCATVCPKRP